MKSRLRIIFQGVVQSLMNALSSFDELEENRLRHINSLLSKMQIYLDENSNVPRGHVRVMPVLDEKKQISQQIILQLPKIEESRRFRSLLYHEMMHIFSIGPLLQVSDGVYHYKWGICSSEYYIKNGEIRDKNFDEMEIINEFLTDICAEYFYTRIVGDKYRTTHFVNPLMHICDCDDIEKMRDVVVAYILNDEKTIKNIFAHLISLDNKVEKDGIFGKWISLKACN